MNVNLLPTIVTSHRKTVPSQAPTNELKNPGYKSNQTSLKRSEQPDEPIDGVNERKVSFGNQTAADITILKEISDFGDGKKLLAQITPYLLTKTNNLNKEGKLNLIKNS